MSKSRLGGFLSLSLIFGLAAPPLAAAQLFPEIRGIPFESMAPTLLVGDRAVIDRNAYKNGKLPKRGDVVMFQDTHSQKINLKRVIGLPGDTVEMRSGRLVLNGKEVGRILVGQVRYLDNTGRARSATEYTEQLPGEDLPHRIFEFGDAKDLDVTPVFKVPLGHYFMMGDNRDNSEDSRAPTGHRELARSNPEKWPYRGINLNGDPADDAIGFVPSVNLMGRATSIALSRNSCKITPALKAEGVQCLEPNVGKSL